VAHNLKLLFLKNYNGSNIFSVKFNFHFTQKYYAVTGLFQSAIEIEKKMVAACMIEGSNFWLSSREAKIDIDCLLNYIMTCI